MGPVYPYRWRARIPGQTTNPGANRAKEIQQRVRALTAVRGLQAAIESRI